MANEIKEIDIFDPKNITAQTVKSYLAGSQDVTNQEMAMFIATCKQLNLNPFLKEVYLIKYKSSPAQIVVSRDAYRKRAQKNESFNGIKTGVIVQNEDGSVEKLDGAFKTPKQELIGAWAEVLIKNVEYPVYVAVSYDEYVQTKTDYNTKEVKPNSMWEKKPMTMLVKVAESQALRLAFPSEFSGTYSEEELPQGETIKDVTEPWTESEKENYVEQKKAELLEQQHKAQQNKITKEVEKVAVNHDSETGEIIENQPELEF